MIISKQENLYDDDWQKCSTEAEREELSGKLSAASDWLYEVDETTPRKVRVVVDSCRCKQVQVPPLLTIVRTRYEPCPVLQAVENK